jgi:hypothetical protein
MGELRMIGPQDPGRGFGEALAEVEAWRPEVVAVSAGAVRAFLREQPGQDRR